MSLPVPPATSALYSLREPSLMVSSTGVLRRQVSEAANEINFNANRSVIDNIKDSV